MSNWIEDFMQSACIPKTPIAVEWDEPLPWKKKESAMQSAASLTVNAPAPATETDERRNQRDYLSHRIYSVWEDKVTAARKAYGMQDDDPPRTPKDLIARLTSGKYIISKNWNEDMDECGYSPRTVVEYIRWRDPALVEDRDGYKKFKEETLRPQYNALRDSVVIKEPASVLAELQAWESAT